MNKLIFLFISVLFFYGCTKSNHEKSIGTKKIDDLSADFKVPKKIFEEITSEIKKESPSLTPVYLFVPLKVMLHPHVEKSVVSEQLLEFPNGGGLLDYSQLIQGVGSFYISFPAEQFEKLHEISHIYYISQSPVKKIDGESFGLGCGRWIDIREKFKKLQKNDFLKLNTTANRHLYLSAGQYIFVFRKQNQVQITHLNILDSKQQHLLCPQFNTEGETYESNFPAE